MLVKCKGEKAQPIASCRTAAIVPQRLRECFCLCPEVRACSSSTFGCQPKNSSDSTDFRASRELPLKAFRVQSRVLLTPLMWILQAFALPRKKKADILARLSGETTLDPASSSLVGFVVPQPVIWGPVVGIFGGEKINRSARTHLKRKQNQSTWSVTSCNKRQNNTSHIYGQVQICVRGEKSINY